MEFLNLTALSAPVSARILPFAVQLSTSSMLLATFATAAVVSLWTAARAIRKRQVRSSRLALRLVATRRSVSRAS